MLLSDVIDMFLALVHKIHDPTFFDVITELILNSTALDEAVLDN